MTKRITRPKWILYRHTRDFNLLCDVADILKCYSKATISTEEKSRLNQKLRELRLYNERNPNLPLDAINHKINQLSFYMFGYQTKINGIDRFMFSPLGNLLLKCKENKEKVAKIFLTMLWAIQYPHPHSGTDTDFNIYPFRLIFKLLTDKRLENRLYAYEITLSIVFITKIDESSYESLVKKILSLRALSDEEIKKELNKDTHSYVNATYEWDYYVSEFLQSAGVLIKKYGKTICQLQHGNTGTFRKVTRNYVTIPNSLIPLLRDLESQYSYSCNPLLLNSPERLRIDIVKEIFNFYPNVLLEHINETERTIEILKLPKLIEEYSNNPENETAYLFEDVLEQGFNMFYNVEAHKIGGAGHTDIECIYLTEDKKKFAVESKSTSTKLTEINIGRLREHREEIGGAYTIVITPRYVPAAQRDIKGSPVVILLANTFAEYLYNCIESDMRKIDYSNFDKIIINNLGEDISKLVSNLTISTFSINRK